MGAEFVSSGASSSLVEDSGSAASWAAELSHSATSGVASEAPSCAGPMSEGATAATKGQLAQPGGSDDGAADVYPGATEV